MPTGTYTVADLVRIDDQTVANFGLAEIQEAFTNDLAAYNAMVNEAVQELADTTTDRLRVYGASSDVEMYEADEYDRGISAKAGEGSTVGFPLKKFVRDIGWTRDYMLQNTVAQIAIAFTAVQEAHTRAMYRELRRAIFGATNYTIRDRFVSPQADLAVKRLVNADGAAIPTGPNAESFNAATHTHYDYLDGASPTAAALTALIEDVIEHGHGNNVRIYINRTHEAAVRLLTGFTAYVDPDFILGTQANQLARRLDTSRLDNRAIGKFGAAEVWTKPWVPANYAFAFDAGDPMKPLAMRQHPVSSVRGLRIVAQLDDYPLYAQVMDSYFGFGAWTRTNGAVLYFAGSASAYVTPTFS